MQHRIIETFDMTQILQPMQAPGDARQEAVAWGPNLTIRFGQASGVKTSDRLNYPFDTNATDGTQNFDGFSMYSFVTDANGQVFYAPSAIASVRTGSWSTSPIWKTGIFSPNDLLSSPTAVAQVTTVTPASVSIGATYTINAIGSGGEIVPISFVATAATAANVAAGLIAAWNASQDYNVLKAIASGTATVVLTARTPGIPFTVTTSAGAGTLTAVTGTANTGFSIADIEVSCPGARILPHNGFVYIP